jgi:repressor LexA
MLQRKGFIQRKPDISRGIEVLGTKGDNIDVPLLGTIAAGEPIPVPTQDSWESTALETIKVPQELIGRKPQLYALKVKGSSMIDALVDDGDIIILEQAATAEDGEMVAAWLKYRNEATLKKLYREPNRIRLQPANRELEPIYVDPEDMEIQGKVMAVFRKLG